MGCQHIIEWWGVTVAEVGGCLLKSRTLVKGCSRVLVNGDTADVGVSGRYQF